jgi:hypothetical protein
MTQTDNRKYYSTSGLLLGNLIVIVWVGLATLSCALFNLWVAFLYLVAVAFLIFYVMGKKGCVTCYYCKNCTIGMGKLPYLFFRRGGTANVNKRALRVFAINYWLLSALPILLIAYSLYQEFTVLKVALLVGILVFSVYTGVLRWRTLAGKTR